MDYYQHVVIDYLRASRTVFVNTEFCIQLNKHKNPDRSGPHWYCDAVAVDFRSKVIFLCEISYSKSLASLVNRLQAWNEHWGGVKTALSRDGHLPEEWAVRPWLFIPNEYRQQLNTALARIGDGPLLQASPKITDLEEVQPWKYRSWDRNEKPNHSDSLVALA